VQEFEDDPAVGALASGGYAIAYTDRVPNELPDISVQLFTAKGARQRELPVNEQRDGLMGDPSIVGLRGGGFVVGWTVFSQTDNANRGNFIRVFDRGNRPVGGDIPVAGAGYGDAPEVAQLGGVGEFLLTYNSPQGVKARRFVRKP
jgi:hypothetical protein